MSEITDISSVLAELHKQVLAEMVSEKEHTKKQNEDEMNEKEKNNYLVLRSAIGHFKNDFSFEDAIESWHKKRELKFRTERDSVLTHDDYSGWYHKDFYKIAPLNNKEKIKNELLRSGFYKVPVGFKMDWRQSKLYQEVFDNFFNQFVINGENNYGYYFYGNIGVGKTTLLTSIARILTIFLTAELRYITMPRLVRLITSIDFDDKHQIAKLENCDILFIDDLGIEKCTTDNQEAVIRDFFSYRYGNGLVNIIAGNIDIRTQQKKNSFNRQMADYLNDSKYYKIVEMSGKSKRI